MINFNQPPYTGKEKQYVLAAMQSQKMSGDGEYTKKCQYWFEKHLGCIKALLTPSCTHALEMAAILVGIQPGDEVIMPSYTFVSTANAFVMRGAKIVFVDIRPDTMNINENLIEAAITTRTKAIVPVHYGGVGCDMDVIMGIAAKHGLFVIEDAAQAIMSTYKERPLGSIGHLAAFSFHETKNLTSGGEGGLLVINDEQFANRAEVIREKGTNRSQFFRGMVDKYSWVDIGSSYLPSELQSAYLWAQLELASEITNNRIQTWNYYFEHLSDLGSIELAHIPDYCKHNGHLFFIKTTNLARRASLLSHLRNDDITAVFHYVPLHSSVAGEAYSVFHGDDIYTTKESERLVRLPMWYGIEESTIAHVVRSIRRHFGNS